MNIGLSLDWWRCPDGVEIYEFHPPPPPNPLMEYIDTGPPYPKYARTKSAKREALHFECENFRDALVLKFASAKTEEDLIRFMSNYGMPKFTVALEVAEERRAASRDMLLDDPPLVDEPPLVPADTVMEVELDSLRRAQKELLDLMRSDSVADFVERFAAKAQVTMTAPENGARPGLMLRSHGLFEFMKLEAAQIVCGAEVTTCPHCGNPLVMGGEKAKRTDSKYCSPRCRLAAHRLRKKTATKQGKRSKRTK